MRTLVLAALTTQVVGLVAVDVAVWRATAALRRGRVARPRTVPAGERTSRWTFLPASIGATLACAAILASVPTIAALGVFVFAAGLGRRVTAVRMEEDAVVTSFGVGGPAVLRHRDVVMVRASRTFLGAWTVRGASGRTIRLMPSDLLGKKDVLSTVVARAGLVFDGRAWVSRRSASPSSSWGGRRIGRSSCPAEEPRTSSARSRGR